MFGQHFAFQSPTSWEALFFFPTLLLGSAIFNIAQSNHIAVHVCYILVIFSPFSQLLRVWSLSLSQFPLTAKCRSTEIVCKLR
jgi:hypothetical protein